MGGEINKRDALVGGYFGVRGKPGARENPQELTRMNPTKSPSNSGENTRTDRLMKADCRLPLPSEILFPVTDRKHTQRSTYKQGA